MITQIATRFV